MALDFRFTFYKYIALRFLVFIIISIRYGWFFIKIDALNPTHSNINRYFLGISRLYIMCFRVKGFGFRFVSLYNKGIYLKLDYTHKLCILPITNHKIRYKHKYKFLIKGRNILLLKSIFSFFIFFLLRKVYKKLGIFLKGTIYKAKLSKKKTKY